MAKIRNTNISSTPRISMRRSALLATMGDKDRAVTRLAPLFVGLDVAYDVAGKSTERVTNYDGGTTSELRDKICRLRWRLLNARTAQRHTELGQARDTVDQILSALRPVT